MDFGLLWVQSIDALAEALEAFEGGVVIISHDAQLLSRVCDETSEVRLASLMALHDRPLRQQCRHGPEPWPIILPVVCSMQHRQS